jgi:alcohol dehydrogenase
MSSSPQDITPPLLEKFDYQPRTRLVFGVGAVDGVGELARDLSAKKVLLVTDRGIVAAGHADHVRRALETAGLTVACYDQTEENPSTECVDKCVAFARTAGIDTIVGLGGGSSMDTAKGCNFLLTNGGRMQDYWGIGKATKPMLPMIAIPTTAGTGSECQSFALITDAATHQKMACGDLKAAARVAILDPALTVSQPPRVAACTGVDTIAHAVETAVTKKRNPLSLMFSHEAFRLGLAALPEVLAQPGNLEARGRMQLAAAFGGAAIENSMLGAAHAAANPLTACFGIVHGQAVGLMLPAVVRFNAEDSATRRAYAELAWAAGIGRHDCTLKTVVGALVEKLDSLLAQAAMQRSLSDCGVDRVALPQLAQEAARQWTATFNPRPINARDFESIYAAVFGRSRASARIGLAEPFPDRV